MRFLGPHSAGEGPHLVPISLKFGSPSGPHFEKSGSPGLVGTVLMAKFATDASGAIWWPNLLLMQVAPSGGQIDRLLSRKFFRSIYRALFS